MLLSLILFGWDIGSGILEFLCYTSLDGHGVVALPKFVAGVTLAKDLVVGCIEAHGESRRGVEETVVGRLEIDECPHRIVLHHIIGNHLAQLTVHLAADERLFGVHHAVSIGRHAEHQCVAAVDFGVVVLQTAVGAPDAAHDAVEWEGEHDGIGMERSLVEMNQGLVLPVDDDGGAVVVGNLGDKVEGVALLVVVGAHGGAAIDAAGALAAKPAVALGALQHVEEGGAVGILGLRGANEGIMVIVGIAKHTHKHGGIEDQHAAQGVGLVVAGMLDRVELAVEVYLQQFTFLVVLLVVAWAHHIGYGLAEKPQAVGGEAIAAEEIGAHGGVGPVIFGDAAHHLLEQRTGLAEVVDLHGGEVDREGLQPDGAVLTQGFDVESVGAVAEIGDDDTGGLSGQLEAVFAILVGLGTRARALDAKLGIGDRLLGIGIQHLALKHTPLAPSGTCSQHKQQGHNRQLDSHIIFFFTQITLMQKPLLCW